MRLNEISKNVNIYRKVKGLRFSLKIPLAFQVWGNVGNQQIRWKKAVPGVGGQSGNVLFWKESEENI